jgi:nicotinamide mononucleotide transporter
MVNLLSVEWTLVSVGDYPLSAIELVGTVLYFASVWLIARKRMLTWPIGIVSVILFALLFYQIRLYAVAIEQVYYLGASVYGWIAWHRARTPRQPAVAAAPGSGGAVAAEVPSGFSRRAAIIAWAVVTAAATAAFAFAVARFHIWMPTAFPEPAAFPVIDALTTVMSFVAMYLMARRRTECWVYWIAVNIVSVWLYWVSGVRFISIQYVVLLGMAAYGMTNWLRTEGASTGVSSGSAS